MVSQLQSALLKVLYECYFDGRSFLDLHAFQQGTTSDDGVFWDEVEELEEQDLIRPYAMGGVYILNPRGVLFVEDHTLADSAQSAQYQQARTQILDRLMRHYEAKGKHATYPYEELARDLSMNSDDVLTQLLLLDAVGYVDAPFLGGAFLITAVGRESVLKWRSQTNVLQDYLDARTLLPQKRGKALERIIAQLTNREGWNVQSNVITPGEELDLVIVKAHAYYLVECKWYNKPVEAKHIRDFYGKLANRNNYRGLFISMSGFTAGAIEHVKSYINHHAIVCFGPLDVEAVVQTTIDLSSLIEQRYRRLTAQRHVEWS
jgi:hypothetical protein